MVPKKCWNHVSDKHYSFFLLYIEVTILSQNGKILNDVSLGNMFENGCYLRRQKRFKIPKSERDPSGSKSRFTSIF